MSENNHFEILMQQKMDGFMVEPASSDWQAIYDRLHPRNKRRIIWWWFPLIAALGAGFFWIYQPTNTRGLADHLSVKTAVTSDKDGSSPDKETPANTSINNQQKENNPAGALSTPTSTANKPVGTENKNVGTSSSKEIKKSRQGIATTVAPVKSTSTKNKKFTSGQNKTTDPIQNAPVDAGKNALAKQNNNNPVDYHTNSVTDPNKNAPTNQRKNTPVVDNANSLTDPNKKEVGDPDNGALTDPGKVAVVDPNKNASTEPNKNTTADQNKDDAQVEKTFSIPVKSKSNRWQWAGYIGAGPNYPSDPLSLGAKALAASAPDYNSGSSITYTTNSRENGWHLAGGVMIEKKMGNNWKFSAGLGINSSTWTTKSEKFKDSVFSGALSTTVKVSSEQHKNQLWMAEVPLQFSNRISGKKAGTLWWSIGINNQFRLMLSQNTLKDSTSRTMSSDSRTLTSAARFYQPQFRAGLMYDHHGKVHWQLQPLFQYSLSGVYNRDISDNTVMANLQLQYRVFLQNKKEGKKAKK